MTSETALEMLRQKAIETGASIIDLGDNFDYANATYEDLQEAWGKNDNTIDLNDYFESTIKARRMDRDIVEANFYDIDELLDKYK